MSFGGSKLINFEFVIIKYKRRLKSFLTLKEKNAIDPIKNAAKGLFARKLVSDMKQESEAKQV